MKTLVAEREANYGSAGNKGRAKCISKPDRGVDGKSNQ